MQPDLDQDTLVNDQINFWVNLWLCIMIDAAAGRCSGPGIVGRHLVMAIDHNLAIKASSLT
tara:strand:- start:3517 stop:3699 length:183 start_codon:yes stop_codon:yes gene_type:complete